MFAQPSLLVWRTPGTASESTDDQERSVLVRNPIVLAQILKRLAFWDVQALIGAGCPELSALVRRHCMKAHFPPAGPSGRCNLLEISRNPFPLFTAFTSLNSLNLTLKSWSSTAQSPLLGLPSTMRHITFFVRHGSPTVFHVIAIPYAQHFPALETLRLRTGWPLEYDDGSHLRKFPVEFIPPHIKTLSLLLSLAFAEEEVFQVCHPIGLEYGKLFPNETATTRHTNFGRFRPGGVPDNGPIYADFLKLVEGVPRDTWKYRFDSLEYFEWARALPGYRNASPSPIPMLMPPTLRHFVENDSSQELHPLPSRRPSLEDARRNSSTDLPTGLQTVYNDSYWDQAWVKMLPKSITKLHLRCNSSFTELDLITRFPALRAFSTNASLDPNKIRFPDSVTSLRFSVWEHTSGLREYTLFSEIPPPASLTYLCVDTPALSGIYACLPSTLTSLDIVCPTTGSYFRSQISPFLPPNLRCLRLKMRDLSSQHLSLLPRGLEEVTLCAESMLLPEWVIGEAWDDQPCVLDLAGLPPQLRHLNIYAHPLKLLIPGDTLARLPRTLESLVLSEVRLSTAEPTLPLAEASSSSSPSSSSSSSISTATSSPFGFLRSAFSSIGNLFVSKPKVAPSFIRDALDMLPPNCWCHIFFQYDTLVRKDVSKETIPTDVRRAVQDMVPFPMLSYPIMNPSMFTSYDFVQNRPQ